MNISPKTANQYWFNTRLLAARAGGAALIGLAFAAAPAYADDPIDLRPVATTAVTASTRYPTYDPFYVSDWSGMTGAFPDGVDDIGAWQWSSDGNQDPSLDWIAWDLGDTYTLSKMHVWNDNAYGDGIKTVDIEVSADGSTWTPTTYTGLSWPDAPNTPDYAGFDQVFSTPITTRYIRFANLVSFGAYGTSEFGYYYVALDEVVFYEAPGTGNDIKSFSVLGYAATISGTNITQYVPLGTDLKTITPTITVSALATVSPGSGVPVDFSTVNPQPYMVISGDHSSTNVYSVTVTTVNGLVVKTYFATTGTGNLDPISNLMALTPAATGIQVENIDYHGGTWLLPGSPGGDDFSILWEGWFDVLAAGGPGDYTFGTSSDDGSVVFLDLNRDGVFTSPDERIVNNNAVQPEIAQLGTVTLTNDSVHIVIGYFQGGGGYVMRAGFAPGTVTDFYSLNLINGSSGYFFPSDPHPPTTTTLTITPPNGSGDFTISGTTSPGLAVHLWKSLDLSLGAAGWTDAGSANADTAGAFSFPLNQGSVPRAFYQVKP